MSRVISAEIASLKAKEEGLNVEGSWHQMHFLSGMVLIKQLAVESNQ